MNLILMALAFACADMASFQSPGFAVSIIKAEKVSDNLPSRCRVDGMLDQRTGSGGKPFGIGFALALPDNWNGRFVFQGGGGLNGTVQNPLGAQAAGDASALARGFAVVSTDTGHSGTGAFDASFMADQQAALHFYYVAIGRVALLAKAMIAHYYGRVAERSYYIVRERSTTSTSSARLSIGWKKEKRRTKSSLEAGRRRPLRVHCALIPLTRTTRVTRSSAATEFWPQKAQQK